MHNLVAVIPVRAGSQRVKNKNFKPFCGKTLLQHKIDLIKKLPVDDIIVNTDSEYAIEIAKENGISHHRREEYYASSMCTNSEYHEYLGKVTEAENIMIAQVTAPLIKEDSYRKAINTFMLENEYDSLMSVSIFKKFLWYNGIPINYSVKDAPNSQDLPEYLMPTFGLVLAKRSSLIENRNLIGKAPYFFILDEIESVDIDTELDFEFAEYLFNRINYGKNHI